MLADDFDFEVGKTYRINPQMVVGLPVFYGEFVGTSKINAPNGPGWDVFEFKLETKILGWELKTILLARKEIRDAKEVEAA